MLLPLLLLIVLALLLINEVVHGHDRLLAEDLGLILVVLTLLVLSTDRLTSGRPLARLGRACLLLLHGLRLLCTLLLLALNCLILLLLLLLSKSLSILSSGCRCCCFGSRLELLGSGGPHVDHLHCLADVELGLHDGRVLIHHVIHRLAILVAALLARLLIVALLSFGLLWLIYKYGITNRVRHHSSHFNSIG